MRTGWEAEMDWRVYCSRFTGGDFNPAGAFRKGTFGAIDWEQPS